MLKIRDLLSAKSDTLNSKIIGEKKNNVTPDAKGSLLSRIRAYTLGNSTDENTRQEFIADATSKGYDPFRLTEDNPFKNFSQKRGYASGFSDDLDGKIDASTQSEITGDCWLLTGLNSLSYSEKGAEAIKDAMTFNKNGSVTITFKGVKASYTVSAQELARANNDSNYSKGDDDVLAFELAAEKLREDIASGKIHFSSNSPFYVGDTTSGETGTKSIQGGYTEQLYYLLTGKLSKTSNDPDEIEGYLDKFQNNPNVAAMACSIKGEGDDRTCITVKDASGKDVQLYNAHAYAVKSVDDKTVTIVNPWDSTQEIVLSRDTFSQIANVSYCDISDKSKDYSGVFQKAVKFIKNKMNDLFENGSEILELDILNMLIENVFKSDIFKFKKSKEAN